MDVACSDMAGLDHQRKGFHTFLMTGDAIIRTNFHPFKPTRQLSLDSQPEPVKEKPKTDRSISHQETTTRDNNNDETDGGSPTDTSPTTQTCMQDKEFIPGFMRVEEQSGESDTTACHTGDSGIDVRLSGELEDGHSVTQSAGHEDHTDHSQLATSDPAEESVGIDEPSAKRLATRLYQLDGFKLPDVCHYLSKSDEFTQRVVTEFMSFFDFTEHSIVDSLRAFLCQIALDGGITKDKETVLLHFTKRYIECNRGTDLANTFHSEDACHTLVCALILLNTDLHDPPEPGSQKVNRKLFIESLSELNDGKDFSRQLLISSYTDIKSQSLVLTGGEEAIKKRLSDALNYGVEPLETDSIQLDSSGARWCYTSSELSSTAGSSLLNQSTSKSHLKDSELMKGYLLKKHCKLANGVKTPSGKRGWKRHFVVLKDLKLILLKSDKRSHSRKTEKFIDLDNAYATVASYYTKRKNGFTITTSDGSEFLFVAGDKEAMEDWIYSINLTMACYSKEEAHEGIVTPQRRPNSYAALLGTLRRMREQLRHYKLQVKEVGGRLLHNQNELPEKGATKQHIQELTENKLLQQRYLQKYTAYVNILTMHLERFKPRSDSVTESIAEEPISTTSDSEELYLAGSRMSYRLAVYGEREH